MKGGKQQAKKEALEYTKKRFGIRLVKMPFRESWCAKEVYDKVMEKLRKFEEGINETSTERNK